MSKFRITYTDPETQERKSVIEEFEDWTGRAMLNGVETGPVLTITAREWAEDAGYAYADKGAYTVKEIRP